MVVLWAVSLATHAAVPVSIDHAEPIHLALPSPTGGTQKPRLTAASASFDAFGRRFQLELVANDRLLAGLSPRNIAQLNQLELFKGTLADSPGSWVRISRVAGELEGAIWDGVELYYIGSRARLQSHLRSPVSASSSTLMYRSSDSHGGAAEGVCGASSATGAGGAANGLTRYKSLARELKQIAALAAAGEISVGLIGDYEFTAVRGSVASMELLSRMNIVEGIFSSQVGINIIVNQVEVFPNDTDPFTTSDSRALLQQVGAYRSSSPTLRSHALVHLVTGKVLRDLVLGVGYIGSLCEATTGVGLSEEQGFAPDTALIMAHEIGHNFGAQHDGEAGSVCSATPKTFLMSPNANGSSTFSQCSIDTMHSEIGSAACVMPARQRDVAVTAPVSPIVTVVNGSFELAADISSIGDAPARDIFVSVVSPFSYPFTSMSMPGATCQITQGGGSCRIAELGPDEVTRLTATINAPPSPGTQEFVIQAQASYEQSTANNMVRIPVQVNAIFDAAIDITPAAPVAVAGTPFDVDVDVTATGAGVLQGLNATFNLYGLNMVSGPCTQTYANLDCPIGTLVPGETRRLHLTLVATTAGTSTSGNVTLTLASAPYEPLRSRSFNVSVAAAIDLAIDGLPRERIALVGETVELPVTIRSVGAQPMPNAQIRFTHALNVATEFLAPGATCSEVGHELTCDLGTLANGDVVHATLKLTSQDVKRGYIGIEVPTTTGDEVRANSSYRMTLDVRYGIDVAAQVTGNTYAARDGLPVTLNLPFVSKGVEYPNDVVAMVSVPDEIVISGAYIAGGQCSFSPHAASCTLATMNETHASMELTVTAAIPGSFSGTFSVDASGDEQVQGNSGPLNLDVVANKDARVIVPQNPYGFIGEPVDLSYSVVNSQYALADSVLTFNVSTNVIVDSMAASRGQCTLAGLRIECPLGTLQPHETFTVGIRARGTSGHAQISPRFFSPDDIDMLNDSQQVVITLDAVSSLSLDVPVFPLEGIVGQSLIWPSMYASATQPAHEAYVEIDYDPQFVSSPSMGDVSSCSWDTRPARCSLGTLYSGGVALRFTYVPVRAGSIPIVIRIGARNARDPAVVHKTVQVTIADLPNPASPPPSSPPRGSGGGGGGGNPGAVTLMALLFMLLARQRDITPRRVARMAK